MPYNLIVIVLIIIIVHGLPSSLMFISTSSSSNPCSLCSRISLVTVVRTFCNSTRLPFKGLGVSWSPRISASPFFFKYKIDTCCTVSKQSKNLGPQKPKPSPSPPKYTTISIISIIMIIATSFVYLPLFSPILSELSLFATLHLGFFGQLRLFSPGWFLQFIIGIVERLYRFIMC